MLAIVAIVATYVIATRGTSSTPIVVVDAAVAIDASAPDARAHDAAVEVDASVTVPEVDARVAPSDAARRPLSDAGAAPDVDAASTAPPTLLRKVTIGATPWASFTVDDDPTSHETPETIQLAPGPHRIHFSNSQLGVTRTVTIDVPADRDIKHVEPLGAP